MARCAGLVAALPLLLQATVAFLHTASPHLSAASAAVAGKRTSSRLCVAQMGVQEGGGQQREQLSRRRALQSVAAAGVAAICSSGSAQEAAAAMPATFSVTFESGPVGIELAEALRSQPCSVIVKSVRAGSKAAADRRIVPGLGVSVVGALDVCKGKSPPEVAKFIKTAPYPLTLIFKYPPVAEDTPTATGQAQAPAGGDSPYSAQTASGSSPQVEAEGAVSLGTEAPQQPVEQLMVKRLTRARPCGMVSQEGDLIEIRYTARIADTMREYDASDKRGTGQPYAITLGRGDVVRGLDLSLYDMCIGERRRVEVPAGLAYGAKGNSLFGVPANSALVFGVQLVSINGVTDETATRDSNYYTGDPCNDEARRAGVASGLCDRLAK
eukprot:TRINITY_DN26_c0_g1_i1.p1 TRINITY_DN26_c0_g1~~TRINITY_DN26_c0_g1_i1.p1  ORF type:complete len:383 (-),score=97.84 TRINITY_DN26_c0_g1_i1:474-1622(-)